MIDYKRRETGTSSKQPKAHSQMQQQRRPVPAADPLPTLRTRRHLPPRAFAQLHALLLTSGHARHSPHLAALLRLCPHSPLSHRLRLLLAAPLPPTTFLANSLLLASTSPSSPPRIHLPSALALYSLLFLLPPSAAPLRPNAFTYPPLLRAAPPRAARALATHSIKFLGADAAARDRVLGAALLDALARCGRLEACRAVFRRIHRPDLPAWNALLSAYARRACADAAAEVLRLFTRLVVLSPLAPNEITLVAVVCACAELGALGHGVWAHAYVLRRRLALNCFVVTALVEMYTRCGRLDLAHQLFLTAADRLDTRCYNAMLQGLAVHGHGRAALGLFDRMWCHEGVPVDSVTMLAVMCACAHAGLVDEGRHYFERMEAEFGIVPRIEHYGCLVDMLSRAGRLDDAEKVIQGMDGTPNAAMYRSLIQACGIHGKLDLGERMIRQLMELQPEQHSGNYVMLSNFYARMGRWEDAKKSRKEMKDMGIDKSPGSSILDIDGVLHEFLMGDKTHPSSTQIYAMVEEIEARLREHGRQPSTAAMLFDVEEEDKEDALSYHSERLAIAYAPIASASGVPIRIIKNLRVCSDCHEITKLVSRVYGRDIIMRDRTRFHHFRDGKCSCRDFW